MTSNVTNEERTVAILCVDDEPNVLSALTRSFRGKFNVTTAVGAEAGLAALEEKGPFAVVVSDLRMPEMDGISFLAEVRRRSPETVRVLLTGYADVTSAVRAVNQGEIFRFLTKPTTTEDMTLALSAALEQHWLITSERVLLQQTLHGSIKAVTDVLALVNPSAFGRAIRAKALVGELANQIEPETQWQVEIAAMLSQVGCVTLLPATVDKLYRGEALSITESMAAARLPRIAAELIADIPRIETVRKILEYQNLPFDRSENWPEGLTRSQIPRGTFILKVALDFDLLESQGLDPSVAIATLASRAGLYDPGVLEALTSLRASAPTHRVREVELGSVQPGAVLADDVRSETGILLMARGQQVTNRMVDRIRMMSKAHAKQVVRVIVSNTPTAAVEEDAGG